MKSINYKGKILSLDTPIVMGIINITPDSFYKGFSGSSSDEIVQLAGQMQKDGAHIIDVGGQSTRPGSERISAYEEAERIVPVISAIIKSFPDLIISVDTYHAHVAKEAVAAGASIVNDISAGDMDKEMIATVAKLNVPYICMHMKGVPETMQKNPKYEDVVGEVIDYLARKKFECNNAGIKDVIIDPGYGFGKTLRQNYELVSCLEYFKIIEAPILVGFSRKGMVYKVLDTTPDGALNGSTALHFAALERGANILRVHDVKEAVECIKIWREVEDATPAC